MYSSTYHEGVLALDRDLSDLTVLSEGLLKIFSTCAATHATYVYLWVP